MVKANAACLVFSLMAIVLLAPAAEANQINLQFYMHDVVVGRNRTAVPVGVGSITRPGLGAMLVIDDALTQSPSPDSAIIGRAQGMYIFDSLNLADSDILLVFTAIFKTPEYRDSTLSIQGADRILMKQREVSIVGGTGKFRFARGFAIIETVSTSLVFNAVLRFNVTLTLN
eukprot:Gb_24573 [translate_table: standard]